MAHGSTSHPGVPSHLHHAGHFAGVDPSHEQLYDVDFDDDQEFHIHGAGYDFSQDRYGADDEDDDDPNLPPVLESPGRLFNSAAVLEETSAAAPGAAPRSGFLARLGLSSASSAHGIEDESSIALQPIKPREAGGRSTAGALGGSGDDDDDGTGIPGQGDMLTDISEDTVSIWRWKDVSEEAMIQIRLALPLVLSFILQISFSMMMFIAVGQTNTAKELAGATLGYMYCNVTGVSMGMGMATAMDTLCSQAYGRNPKSPLVGVFLQRAVVIMLLACIPMAILWFLAEPILIALWQDPEIAHLAGQFSRRLLPGLPFFLVFDCLRKYLQCQGKTVPAFIALIIGTVICVAGNFGGITGLGWGFHAAPWVLAATWMSLPVSLLIIIWFGGLHRDTWGGWSIEAMRGWGEYFKLALPGMAMFCNEVWAFEIMALAAGVIGHVELATQSILLNTTSATFMIPFAIGISANTRVGNMLGAGRPMHARHSVYVSLMIALTMAVVLASLFFIVRPWWGRLFIDDPQVIELVRQVFVICGAFQLMDGIQAVLAGILRGIGKQTQGAILNFVGYTLLGLPLGYVFCFVLEGHLQGMWWAITLALSFSAITYLIIIIRTDWNKEVIKAREREKANAAQSTNEDKNPDGSDEESNFGIDHTSRRSSFGSNDDQDDEQDDDELRQMRNFN